MKQARIELVNMIVFHLYVRYDVLFIREKKTKICFFDYLADQHSYELVKLNTTDEPPSLRQVPRFKQPATDGMSRLISFFLYTYICKTSSFFFFRGLYL
jgi:hypothetical protein